LEEHFTVTITRQFGSMGRPIAKKMAAILGIEYYDRDIVEKASKDMNLPISVVSDSEEAVRHTFLNMSFPLGVGTTEIQDRIYTNQSRIIREVADKEDCIIVGRCADYILREHKNSMHIFIYASPEDRLNNCINYLMMEPLEAKKMIKAVDKSRNSYHKHYAGYLPNDCRYKDILINSSLMGIEGTAEYLAEAVKRQFI